MKTAKKSFDLDKINVSFLTSSHTLPLVITPRFDDSIEFISNWLQQNRDWVRSQVQKYGAVLIRGFQIKTALDYEKAILSVDPNLCNKYRGTSPRSLYDGTNYTFSAAEVPVNYPIAQHLEMSFLKSPPKNIYFGCLKESKSLGGETTLCDFRAVYNTISPSLRDKLQSKKIKYYRKNSIVGEKWTYDVAAMKSWKELFGTSDKEEIEKICREENAPQVQWDGDSFLQQWIDEPFQIHPETNEFVWFNHSQVFHWTTFPAELWFAFCRLKDVQLFLHLLLVSIYTFIKYGLLGYKMALDTTFGDGTPITFKEMNEIRDAIHENMVFSRWQRGDILCIDNFSTSHGRQPTYDKGRRVVVSWSHPMDKDAATNQTQSISLAHPQKGEEKLLFDHSEHLPDLQSITPDSTPDSSLTKTEAQELKQSLLSDQVKARLSHMDTFPDKSCHRRRRSCPTLFEANSEFWKSH